MFQFDPKILKALQKAGEQMMKEAKERRRWNMTPPTSFATGGYVSGMDFDEIYYDDPDPEHLNPEGTHIIDTGGEENCIPFYQKSFKSDVTTAQKIRAIKFIIALETAEEL